MKDKPLWLQRIMLVLVAPILIVIALCMALNEGLWEFWFEIKGSAMDIADIWRGK